VWRNICSERKRTVAFRLTLKPHERLVLDGAVIRNAGGRTVLIVENEVPILRERDILSPSEVKTPADRVVMAIQLMYVEPDRRDAMRVTYQTLSQELRDAAPSLAADLDLVDGHVSAGRFYQGLRAARQLRDHERRMLDHVR
jgi:flagellar protein FlbT